MSQPTPISVRSLATLPVVVQLGFAGARNLFDPAQPPADPAAFETSI